MDKTPVRGITDIHIHFCDAPRLHEFLSFCEHSGIKKAGLVSLPDLKRGTFNSEVAAALKAAPERFTGFGCLDHRTGRTERNSAAQVKGLHAAGFKGLKLWLGKPAVAKTYGLRLEDDYISGALKAASDRQMPVLLHLADPPDFWTKRADGSSVYTDADGSFESWIDRGEALFSRFPDITFIGAHLLFLAGGIDNLNRIMSEHGRLCLDTAPGRWFYRKLSEQRAEAREFFHRWRNRLLLGSDSMFFPADYTEFPPGNVDKNLITVSRIVNFLAADKTIDDPYPWPDYPPAAVMKLRGLSLDKQTIDMITAGNAEQFFREP